MRGTIGGLWLLLAVTIVVLVVLSLMGCKTSPKFQVGDCIASHSIERWETDPFIMRVEEIGKEKYRFVLVSPPQDAGKQEQYYFNLTDLTYEKVECPK